jgi:hypothetical protein
LELTLINDFQSLDKDTQLAILNTLKGKLHSDSTFFHKAVAKQVQSLAKEAIKLYESNQQTKLVELLSSVSPMAAILLNIEISLVNDKLMEEGSRLSHTLLPYINSINDFSFLPKKSEHIVNMFLHALSCHVKDTEGAVGIGYMVLTLKMNPKLIQSLITFKNNSTCLVDALTCLGFSA